MGALVGVKQLPPDMLQKVLDMDCQERFNPDWKCGKSRPGFLSIGRHALPLLNRLIDIRPKDKIVMDEEFSSEGIEIDEDWF